VKYVLLLGQVIWVGSSSLDVLVEVHKCVEESNVDMLNPNSSTELLSSVFTYVARDATTRKPHPVNRSAPYYLHETRL
jgi:acyl-CoA hydrolase